MRLFLVITLFLFTQARAANVSHEIRYSNNGARQVYLVWGVNNWQLLPESQLPAGSFIKEKVIYTEMSQNADGQFTSTLSVPATSVIDYVFWITRGPLDKGTDIWDLNAPGKDYHTLASPGSITLVESAIPVRPQESLSVLDVSVLLLLLTGSMALVFFIRRRRQSPATSFSTFTIVGGTGFALLFFLFLIRPSVLGISWDLLANPLLTIPLAAGAAYYDLLYVAAFVSFFALLSFLLRKRKKARRFVAGIFVSFCLLSLVAALLNIKVVDLLGKPFNYQWLYYSDFLNSPDARAAMSANLESGEIWSLVATLLAFLFTSYLLMTLLLYFRHRPVLARISLTAVAGVFCLYLLLAPGVISRQKWDKDLLQNPVTAFLESVNPWQPDPGLFTMAVADSLNYRKPASRQNISQASSSFTNVVIFVLESTPAEYVDCYGSHYGATPNLRELASSAVVFRNVYAHAPATNLSMVSMLTSSYPWLSYNSLTEEHPDLSLPSIAEVLKSRGYRTGFFNSADNRYQKAGEFLAHRRFDRISDCRAKSCDGRSFVVEDKSWKFMDGKEDGCTTEELMSWIDESPRQPFFGMMWTYQTHYPYFSVGPEKNFENKNESLNKYLNALNYADSLIGNVVAQLRRKGLLESTLLVVVGDHGEAFGRHDQISHGRKIYEENLHVPCMIINPLFKGHQMDGVGGLVDLAPTIMTLLHQPAPEEWEGEDLFAKNGDSRVYFFAPWSDYLFGYRQGNKKYIYNATKGKTELYDLSADPLESVNLSSEAGKEIAIHHQRLAAWTQYVNRRTEEIIARSAGKKVLAQTR
jgi:lipoteichoic acid synthase